MEKLFERNFFGEIVWEELLIKINKDLMFLSRFWSNARKKEEEFLILRSVTQAHST